MDTIEQSKTLIHFGHANGLPAQVYTKLFDLLADDYHVIYPSCSLGTSPEFPVDKDWSNLADQIIQSIEQQANGHQVIGIGHSLGAVSTLLASFKRPDLFKQVILLDPPLIMGFASFAFDIAKRFFPKKVDQMTPAKLSLKRRDHWESRQQAFDLLHSKKLYQAFDPACFQAYIDYGLVEDVVNGGVTLTIPKAIEVEIFRSGPSYWWLPHKKPEMPVHMIAGSESPFLKQKFPQIAKKKLGIPYTVFNGGHMFPLEHPVEIVDLIRDLIKKI